MKIIKTGWLICSWNHVIKNGILVIKENKVLAVLSEDQWETEKEKWTCAEGTEILNKRNSIVFPGFVNAHMHQYGVLSHGIPQAGKVTDFKTFLENYWWPFIENRIRKKEVLITAKSTMAEMIRSGITSFCDILEAPYTEEDTLIAQGEVIQKAGMRAIVSLESSQRVSEENGQNCLKQNVQAVRHFQKEPGLVRGAICTHTTFTCTEKFIEKAAEYARENDAILQFHLNESKYEPEWLREHKRELPVNIYKKADALGRNTIATQCVKMKEEEIKYLKETETQVVHMPVSNCEVGGGIAPVPYMIEKGMKPALGTDGYVNDFFQVMRQAFLIHKVALESTETMPAALVFRMATEYGAQVMGLNDCGTLEPGKMADFVVYEDRQPTPVTLGNIYDQLVVYGDSRSVTDVMIDGKWIMKDSRILTMKEEKVREEVRLCAEEFWQTIIQEERQDSGKENIS